MPTMHMLHTMPTNYLKFQIFSFLFKFEASKNVTVLKAWMGTLMVDNDLDIVLDLSKTNVPNSGFIY